MKKELLCPAGNILAAYAAINNGADAVYLSGKSFGARSFADNFSNEEIVEIIKYAHLLGVKIYVTVNTLVSDENFENAVEFIKFLHIENVDAVILQDIGLANVAHKKFPNLEMHASTQMHNLDNYSCEFLKNIGFKRIVVARELPVEDINKLDTDLEIEAFVHGSLCISYSGECLFSSMAMNRSGNLGSCSQLCRMPYKLEVNNQEVKKNGQYLLSPKDLATFYDFDKIMESNITSLKIEGRMKSHQYVALITKIYRKLIDAYYENKEVLIEKEINDLKYLFNRGLTGGDILSDSGKMNIKRGNHAGVLIGEVLSVNEKIITIKLCNNLKIKDGIKFENADKGLTVYNMYINNKEVKSASINDIITIPNNISLTEKDAVLKTYDDLINEALSKTEPKKIKIKILVEALKNETLKISFIDGKNTFSCEKSVVESSLNREITEEEIKEKITKLGSTVYICDSIKINKSEKIFIRLSDINEARRELSDKLDESRLARKNKFVENTFENEFKFTFSTRNVAVHVKNKRQLEIVKNYPVDKIYTDNKNLILENPSLNIYYEVLLNEEKCDFDKILVNSTSDIIKYKEKTMDLNYTVNAFNSETINYLSQFGKPTFSPELSLFDIKKMNKKVVNKARLLIYGKPRVMMMNHCLLFNERKCDTCNFSGLNKNLVDSFNRNYTVTCKNRINYIYNHKPLLKIRDLKDFIETGVTNFRIDFLDETDYEMRKILNEYFEN